MAKVSCFLSFLIFSFSAFSVFQVSVSAMKLKVRPKGVVWFLENQPIELTCTVNNWTKGDDKPRWTKYNNFDFMPAENDTEYKITEHHDKGSKRFISTLTKASASVKDYLDFVCSVNTSIESNIIHMRPFSVDYKDVNISVGFDTSLECRPQTTFEAVRTSWLKDGVPIQDVPELQNRLSIGEDNQSISFEDSRTTDGGVYTCLIVFNPDIPVGKQEFEIDITALGKPYIKQAESPDELQTITNTSVVLLCPARGHPKPQVIWFKGQEVLEPSERITFRDLDGVESGRLDITNLTSDDLGQFTCSAESSWGKTTLTFDVKDPEAGNVAPRSKGFVWSVALGLVSVVLLSSNRWFIT